jgi:hypothetical protein
MSSGAESGPAELRETSVVGPDRSRTGRVTRPERLIASTSIASSAGLLLVSNITSKKMRFAPAAVSLSVSCA